MKKLLFAFLIPISLLFTACENPFGGGGDLDLNKAAQFGTCVQGCYQSTFGTQEAVIVE